MRVHFYTHGWIHMYVYKLRQLSLQLNSFEAFKWRDLYPLVSESVDKKMAKSCSVLIAFWFLTDSMKCELCFPFSRPPLFPTLWGKCCKEPGIKWTVAYSLRKLKMISHEPTFCRLCEMLIRPLIVFKWICFTATQTHIIFIILNVKWNWFVNYSN